MRRQYRESADTDEEAGAESYDGSYGRNESYGSQDFIKPSDGKTGVSQDFNDLNTSSQEKDDVSIPTPSIPAMRTRRSSGAAAGPPASSGKTKLVETTTVVVSAKSTAPAKTVASTACAASTSSTSSTVRIAATTPFKSFGTVCVVKRPSTINKKKNIKVYALQNTFYAYPIDATPEVKSEINEKIKQVSDDFEFQKYETEVYEFGLPFEVEEVCKISAGYGTAPKRHKIASNKRKRTKVDTSSSSESEDEQEEADATSSAPTKKRR